MITLFLMNSIVVISAWLITWRMLKFKSLIDSLIALFILYLSQIILSELALGILNQLYLINLIFLNSVILILVYIFTRKKTSNFNKEKLKSRIFELISNKTMLFIACVIFGFAAAKIFANLISPPFGWDNLNYHFTFPVEWLKNGNLYNPITIADDPSPPYYPINGSLLFLWFILPLGNVFLADLGQIPFFGLAILAIYHIARRLHLNRELAFYTAGLFLLIPNLFKQLEIAYVDVMVAALFLACINYLFLLKTRISKATVLIFSLSLGLLIGTKTTGVPFSALLIVPFLFNFFKKIKKSYLLILVLIIVICTGGFSYIRNFIQTNNPLYPLDFNLLGKTIFNGVMNIQTYGAHFKQSDYSITKLLFHEGLGGQTIVFIFPAIFLALPTILLKKRKELHFQLIYFSILPILIYLVYRYAIPLANVRYLYALMGIAMVLGFLCANIFCVPRLILRILVVISAISSIAELAKDAELIAALAISFSLFSLGIMIIKKKLGLTFINRRDHLRIVVIIFGFLFISLLGLLKLDYSKNEYDRYESMREYSGFWPDAISAWRWLNTNTKGNNIAYTGRPVPFPLYCENFKNNVYYVSVNNTDPAKLHFFPNSYYSWGHDFLSLHRNLTNPGNYRGNANYSVWLKNLLRRKTDFLFVYSLHQTKEIFFPKEDQWARQNPDRFNLVFKKDSVHIYKIIRDSSI